MISASSRMLYGGVQHNPPSRFLSDCGGQLDHGTQMNEAPRMFVDPYDQTPQMVELNQGDKVSHHLFGKGTVLSVDGETLTVSFGGRGTKKLNAAFAPLKKL